MPTAVVTDRPAQHGTSGSCARQNAEWLPGMTIIRVKTGVFTLLEHRFRSHFGPSWFFISDPVTVSKRFGNINRFIFGSARFVHVFDL